MTPNFFYSISPKKIYKHFKTSNHPHFTDDTVKKCKDFLKLLEDIGKCHLEKKRIEIQSNLSSIVVDLWVMMLKDSIDKLNKYNGIDYKDTIKGISRLKNYLESFQNSELLFYASDNWYRDTIYHQVWFYFVGEYVFDKFGIMEILIDNLVWYCDPLEDDKDKSGEARYAFFCIIALCHDLGKPLEKFHSINSSIKDMLFNFKFLHFTPFKIEFPQTYNEMMKYLIKFLSKSGFKIKKDDIKKFSEIQQLINLDSNQETPDGSPLSKGHITIDTLFVKMEKKLEDLPFIQALFSTALSELNHGILSCLLLLESFRSFRDGLIYKHKNEKGMNEIYYVQKSYLTALGILKAIAYHGIEDIIISEINLPYFWICLIDDLIEWYRPTRAGKDFISSGLCRVKIKKPHFDELTDKKLIKKIHIGFFFYIAKDNEDQKYNKNIKDIIHFFIDKLTKYYYILNINSFEFHIDVNFKEKLGGRIKLKYLYENRDDIQKSKIFIKYDCNSTPDYEDNSEKKEIQKLLMKGINGAKKEIYNKLFKENKA
ncbi:MAG: hypothetical protein ACFFCV_09985 [Promethearchaeota archaeon]